jgi:hypothetical protein
MKTLSLKIDSSIFEEIEKIVSQLKHLEIGISMKPLNFLSFFKGVNFFRKNSKKSPNYHKMNL